MRPANSYKAEYFRAASGIMPRRPAPYLGQATNKNLATSLARKKQKELESAEAIVNVAINA